MPRYFEITSLYGCDIIIACLFLIALSGTALGDNPQTVTEIGNVTEIANSGFTLKLSNSAYELYYDEETGGIAVKSLKSGYIWYSNPQAQADSLAADQEGNFLRSQIIIEYYLDQKLTSMNSYADSLINKLPETTVEKGVLSVKYDFGKEVYSNDMLPTVVSKERMEKEILPKLSDSGRELIMSRYELFEKDKMDKALYDTVSVNFPIIAEHDIYVRGTFPDYIGEEIYETFKSAGYTTEDLEKDCEENGVENTYTEPVLFSVTVDYKLTEEGLCAAVDPKKITYSSEKPIGIRLLPYFGSASTNDTGYMLVPDGSGSLIYFNNGKTAAEVYSKPIIGEDKVITKTETEPACQISALPVFALSNQKAGFLAVIDSGYECASVNASVSGKNNSYNSIFASFNISTADLVTVTSGSDGQLLVISDEFISCPCSVSYIFTDEYTDYSAFAAMYRKYLNKNGFLKKYDDNAGALNIEFIGTALVNKKLLGFSYTGLKALTTFEEAKKIIDGLDINDVSVRYTNAVNGGRIQTRADKIKLERSVGDKKTLGGLAEKSAGLAIAMNLQTVSDTSKNSAVKKLDNSIAKQFTYDPVSRYMESRSYSVLLSPDILLKKGEKLMKSAVSQKISAVSVNDITCMLTSDYDKKHTYDRHQTREIYGEYLEAMCNSGLEIQSDTAAVYALKYISRIWNIPTSDSGYFIEDQSVPFYAMVVRGYIPYCASAINENSDYGKAFLNSVEIGAGIQYSWIYKTAQKVVSSAENYYDRLYDKTVNDAAEYYAEYSELYEKLKGAEIISHTVLENGLKCTEYSNGVTVYVNYSDTEINFDGISVGAMNFVWSKQ